MRRKRLKKENMTNKIEHINKLKEQGLTEIKWNELSEEQLTKLKIFLKINSCGIWKVIYVPHNRYLLR